MNAMELSAEASIGNSSSEKASEFPKLPKNSPAEEQKGNSSRTTLNVNRNNISEKETNENVVRQENPFGEQEGNSLAVAVEGHAANAGAYRHYLALYDPRTVLATFIYIKQRQYHPKRRPIDAPGAYFDTVLKAWSAFGPYEAACEAYQRAYTQVEEGKLVRKSRLLPGVPVEVQKLVSDFWGWSYDEIAAMLQRSATDASLFGGDASPERGKPQTARWLSAQNQLPEPRYVPNQWMDRDEALCLIERISREAQTISDLSLQLVLEPRPYYPRGTSQTVYLVDVVIERIPVVYAEPMQWHTYYHNVQACLSI